MAGLVLALAVSPTGYYRMWLLSDQIAVGFMMVAAVALYPYLTRGSVRWLAVAAVAAALGGLTQTYALIPFLVVGGWCLAVSVWRRKPDYLLGGALVAAPLTTLILVKAWLANVAHVDVPRPLGLIRFNFNMLDFYANAWSFAFLPLIPLLVALAIYRRREVAASPVLAGYWLAVLAFLVSTFFYQVEDFRFTIPTTLMLGLAIVATLPGERPLPRPRELIVLTALLAAFLGIVLAPPSYWKPRWSELEVKPSNNYLARLLTLEPRDRFALAVHCDVIAFCPEVRIRPLISEYRRVWVGIYRYLDSADEFTELAAYDDQIYPGVFELRNSNACCQPDDTFTHGLPRSQSVAGDWDGLPRHNVVGRNTGAETSGVFRAGVWFLRNTNSESPAEVELLFGEEGDIPVAGNWDGNRTDTIGLYRDGLWSLRNSNSTGPADLQFVFGQLGDLPVVGDWDGDGVDTIGIFRSGRWLLRNSTDAGPPEVEFNFGGPGDIPVTGDWDGDGVDNLGVFKRGLWRLRITNEAVSSSIEFTFGELDDSPLVGDWDNDGVDTVAVAGTRFVTSEFTQNLAALGP